VKHLSEYLLLGALSVISALTMGSEGGGQTPGKVTYESITEGFGIPLGEPFQPDMVERVIERHSGNTKYTVQPRKPHPLFSRYEVTTKGDDGPVDTVTGYHHCNKNDPKPIEDFEDLKHALENKYGPSQTVRVRDERKKPRKNKGWVYQARIRIDQGDRSVFLQINTGFNYTCYIKYTYKDRNAQRKQEPVKR
jgi:hypothetical protein